MTGTATGTDGSTQAQTARKRFFRRFFGRDDRWRHEVVYAVFLALIAVFGWVWPSDGLKWLTFILAMCFAGARIDAILDD